MQIEAGPINVLDWELGCGSVAQHLLLLSTALVFMTYSYIQKRMNLSLMMACGINSISL